MACDVLGLRRTPRVTPSRGSRISLTPSDSRAASAHEQQSDDGMCCGGGTQFVVEEEGLLLPVPVLATAWGGAAPENLVLAPAMQRLEITPCSHHMRRALRIQWVRNTTLTVSDCG